MKVKNIIRDNSIYMEKRARSKPLVSVFLPTFRRAKSGHFEKAVRSVIGQTFLDWELIIVDDCSTDGTFDIIKELMAEDERISCIRHKSNVGLPAISEYEAYMKSEGDYIAFIFDDCEWMPDALEKTLEFMKEKELQAAYGVYRLIYDEDDNYIELGSSSKPIEMIEQTNFIANAAVVLQREVIETVGLYDPHLCLVRLCDWDLWRRVLRKYDFRPTDILMGFEKGYVLSDSLGNSYKMDHWSVAEYISIEREKCLLPQFFEDFNIYEVFGKRSEHFLDSIREFSHDFENKEWFSQEDEDLLRLNSEACVAKEVRRLVLICNGIDATNTLSFGRIHNSSNIVIRYVPDYVMLLDAFVLADAMVLIRNLIYPQAFPFDISNTSVPLYYYVDDNFIELAKEFGEVGDIVKIAELTTADNLSKYEGIIASTSALADYFLDNKIHDNVLVMEPVFKDKADYKKMNASKSLTVAYMGGHHRLDALKAYVVPALERISKSTGVTFCCPELVADSLCVCNEANIKIERIPFTNNLDLALEQYGNMSIDALIHCGTDLRNNPYKTKNALLNATAIDAVLIASNTPPFYEMEHDDLYLVAENTVEGWTSSIERLFEESTKNRILCSARDYCKNKYAADIVLGDLVRDLNKRKTLTKEVCVRRSNELLLILLKTIRESPQPGPDSTAVVIEEPPVLEKVVLPAETPDLPPWANPVEVDEKSSQMLLLSSVDLAGIGLMLRAEDERLVRGRINMVIYGNGRILRNVTVDLRDIVSDKWLLIEFEPIFNVNGVPLTIEFRVDYDAGSTRIAVYSDSRECLSKGDSPWCICLQHASCESSWQLA